MPKPLYTCIKFLFLLCDRDYVTALCSQESDTVCLATCVLYVFPCEVFMLIAQYFED